MNIEQIIELKNKIVGKMIIEGWNEQSANEMADYLDLYSRQILEAIRESEEKDWTIDTDDQNRNLISYKDGRRELVGDDWAIICFLHKQKNDSITKLTTIINNLKPTDGE